MTMRERLLTLLEPVVNGLGYELLELEHKGPLVRIYIDRQEGITVDDCAKVSGQVEAVLDAENPIAGGYTLEVSSPGFDRPLRTAAHFRAQLGKRAKLELSVPLDGRRRFTGTLLGIEQEQVAIEVDGKTFNIPLRSLGSARLAD
jgi:ribosome maturation factor RimP